MFHGFHSIESKKRKRIFVCVVLHCRKKLLFHVVGLFCSFGLLTSIDFLQHIFIDNFQP